MSNFIAKTKAFFNKKKSDAKFATAGPGHTLTEDRSKAQSSRSTVSSVPSQRPTAGSSQRPTAAQQAAAEAALRRMNQEKQKNTPKPRHLDNILEEEKRRAAQEAKERDQALLMAKHQQDVYSELNKKLRNFEEQQRYRCSEMGITDSYPKGELMEILAHRIEKSFDGDPLLVAALLIRNCNDTSTTEKINELETCLKTLDTLVTNLGAVDKPPEDREKYRRVRKIKIENKILNIKGGRMFLEAVGFRLDSDGEWFVFQPDEDLTDEDLLQQVAYWKDVLKDVQKIPLELDRQPRVTSEDGRAIVGAPEEQLTDDFFQLSLTEVRQEYDRLLKEREQQETLMTKAMREANKRKIYCRYTRLRFKLPPNVLIEATFHSSENIMQVRQWISEHPYLVKNMIKEFDIVHGIEALGDSHSSKTLEELNLVPSASILVRPR